MSGVLPENGPSYVAAQSADVILSDVRPIRLKVEGLKAINALLDEFLFNILKSANSLSTDRLRASLLELLPTSLGKEALLEAEVELRAYYERMGTGAVSSLGDDSKTFNFQFAFELLRLKCAAYSTLNDSDEDPNAEAFIMEKMKDASAVPFTPVRIAPAALYLTAIVEAMCEHILGNVAKVTARDSSRTDATIQDLYTALCEDESIYGMFKSMKVYEQIGQLSNKPFARNEKHSVSRSHHDSTATATTVMSTSSSSRTRISSDTSATQAGSISGSRSSFDKQRVMKRLISNRSSHEREDSQGAYAHDSASQSNSLRRSVSTQEEKEKNMSFEDTTTLQEFDNLMRTTSTMKVSLTPDRLKTMEAYKQEKDQRAQKMLVNNKLDPDAASVGSGSGQLSLRQVESIVEDEEETAFSKLPPTSRHRQGSITSPPDQPSLAGNRNRSFSMSSSGSRAFGKKLLRNTPPPVASSHMFHSSSLSSMHVPNQAASRQPPSGVDALTFPSRTRKVQRNRESMDLDDIMNGSDDDAASSAKQSKPPVAAPSIRSEHGKRGVSQSTRDLIDFLSEGPPDTRSLAPSLAPSFDGPSSSPKMAAMDSGRKGPGRLQRMISKLSIGGSDKPRASDDGLRTPTRPTPPPVPSLPTKPSITSLYPLANKPIPPRYPRPPSPPPSSPSQSSAEESVATRAKKSGGQDSTDTRSLDTHSLQSRQNQNRVTSPPVAQKRDENTSNHEINGHIPKTADQSSHHGHKSPISPDRTYPITPAPSSRVSPAHDPVSLPPQSMTRTLSFRKPVPPVISPVSQPTETVQPVTHVTPSGLLADNDADEIHRLMSHAGSADECRLILDMFLARAGIRVGGTKATTVALPPNSSTLNDSPLENTVVELLLGGETLPEMPCSPRRLRFKRHKKGLELRPHTADGSLSLTPSESSTPITPLRSPPTPAF